MIDAIYANVAAARLELSGIENPPVAVRDALKRLSDVVELITNDERMQAKKQWVEREAMKAYNASIDPDAHNLHIRAWSELSEDERDLIRAPFADEWERD